MASFLEVKKFICSKLHFRIQSEDDIDERNDIELCAYGINLRERFNFILINNELKELFDKIQQSERNNADYLNDNTFETALNFRSQRLPRHKELPFLSIEDEHADISFTVSDPSIEYCLFLISHLCEYSSAEFRHFMGFYYRPVQYEREPDEDQAPEPAHNWQEAVIGCFRRFLTLKIKYAPEKEQNMDYFGVLKNAYFFTCMYNLDSRFCPIEYHNIADIFPRREFFRIPSESELSIPHRKYNDELVEFYKTAISSTDPFIQYISFYHVLEFYFDEAFKKHLIDIIRDKITLPDFSHKSDAKLFDLAKSVRKELKANADETQGNELETLKYVLLQYVDDIEKLKERIKVLSSDENILSYYQTTKVPFVSGSKAKTIAWSDLAQVHKNISDRIYQTRNALVHSKKENGGGVYNPAKNETDLLHELPLVRAVAEEIIINSSTIV